MEDVDAGVDAAPDASGPVEPTQRLSGKAMDYFVANTPLSDTMIATDGIDPPKMATSGMDGAFTLDAMPSGTKVFLLATRTNYRPTRNVATTIGDEAVEQDVYVLSVADVNRQYATAGVTATPNTAFLAAEMRDAMGMPLVGIPLANVVLHDANDQPVPGIKGPYFFGANGNIDPLLQTSEAHGGRSRVAILDVPAGTHQLKVTYPDGAGGNTTAVVSVAAAENGATLALTGGMMGKPAIDPKFSTDIYPMLQTAAKGGLGCANCHTAGGSGAVLVLDAPAAMTLANINARPGVVNLMTPADSLLLTKPLYEPPPAPQNHGGGATFLDANDEDYKMILLWITNGAKP